MKTRKDIKNNLISILVIISCVLYSCGSDTPKRKYLLQDNGLYKSQWEEDGLLFTQEFLKVGDSMMPHGRLKKSYIIDKANDSFIDADRIIYDSGQIAGETYSYYRNGEYKDVFTYKNGLKNGLGNSFYENGNIKEISYWWNGARLGIQYNFAEYEDRKLLEYRFFDFVGNIFCVMYYDKEDNLVEINGTIIDVDASLRGANDTLKTLNQIIGNGSRFNDYTTRLSYKLYKDGKLLIDSVERNIYLFDNAVFGLFNYYVIKSGVYKYVVIGELIDNKSKAVIRTDTSEFSFVKQ